MDTITKVLVGLSAVAFLLAVTNSAVTGPIMEIPAESFSRAANNLALLAIAVHLAFRAQASRS